MGQGVVLQYYTESGKLAEVEKPIVISNNKRVLCFVLYGEPKLERPLPSAEVEVEHRIVTCVKTKEKVMRNGQLLWVFREESNR